MKTIITPLFILFLSCSVFAADETVHHLKAVNVDIGKAAFASYSEGHYRYIQGGKLVEAYEVDETQPSCILEAGRISFDPEVVYALESTRSLDVDGEQGEIELNFETRSSDPDSYFQFYCFQNTVGATLDTAREALKSVFEIE